MLTPGDDIQFLEEDRVNVLIDDVDPLAYREYQVQGMVLALLDGTSGPLYQVKRDASDYHALVKRALLEKAKDASRQDVVSDLRIVNESITSAQPPIAAPVVNVSFKTSDPPGAFMNAVDRLMYDSSLTHNEANSLLWKLWNPYQDKSYDHASVQRSPIVMFEGEGMDAVSLDPDDVTAEGNRLSNSHCSTVHLIGMLRRDYIKEEDVRVTQSVQVYEGDDVNQVGTLLLRDPYGRLAKNQVMFDAIAYMEKLGSLKPGNRVRVYPPSSTLLTDLDSSFSDLPLRGVIVTNDIKSAAAPSHPSLTVDIDDKGVQKRFSVSGMFNDRWFIHPEDAAAGASEKKDLFEFFPAYILTRAANDNDTDVVIIHKKQGETPVDYELIVSACTPDAADRVASLNDHAMATLFNERRADALLRYPLSRNISHGDAELLRSVFRLNVDREMMTTGTKIGDAEEAETTTVPAVPVPPSKGTPENPESDKEDKKKNKKRKSASKKSAGGGAEDRNNEKTFLKGLDGFDEPAYVYRFKGLEHDLEADSTINRPIYVRNTSDRGTLYFLRLVKNTLESLRDYVHDRNKSDEFVIKKQDKNAKKMTGGRNASSSTSSSQTTSPPQPEDVIESCRDRPLMNCPAETLTNATLNGFRGGDLSEEYTYDDNFCARVKESGNSPFSAFVFSVVQIGDYGKGLVVDRMYQSNPDCVDDTRKKVREQLIANERDSIENMRNFNHDAMIAALEAEIESYSYVVKARRMTPLVGWPQLAAHSVYDQDTEATVAVHARYGDDLPTSMVISFEDREHYSPLASSEGRPAKANARDVLLSAADASDAQRGAMHPLIKIASSLNLEKIVIDGHGKGDVHRGAAAAGVGEEGDVSPKASLDAIVKLRNPPERVALEIQKQVRLIESRKQDIIKRSPKAAENFAEFQSKLVSRIKEQLLSDHARKEILTASAIVYLLAQKRRQQQQDNSNDSSPDWSVSAERVREVANAILLFQFSPEQREKIISDVRERSGSMTGGKRRGKGVSGTEALQEAATPAENERHADPDIISHEELQNEISVVQAMLDKATSVGNNSEIKQLLPSDKKPSNPKDTNIWTGFRPLPVSRAHAHQMQQRTQNDTDDEINATRLILRINEFINTQLRGELLDGSQNAAGKNAPNARNMKKGKAATKKKTGTAASCCLSVLQDHLDHFDYYDDPDIRRVVKKARQSRFDKTDQAAASLAAENLSTLEKRKTEVFASYLDKVNPALDPVIGVENPDILASYLGDATSRQSRRQDRDQDGTTSSRTSPAHETMATYLDCNEALRSKTMIQLAAALKRRDGEEVEKYGSDVLKTANQSWSKIVKVASLNERQQDIWRNVIDTSSLDTTAQAEAAHIAAGFIQNGLRPALHSVVIPKASSAHQNTESEKDPYHSVRSEIARLDPPSLIKKLRDDYVSDVLNRYTNKAPLISSSVGSEEESENTSLFEGWVACAVIGYTLTSAMERILESSVEEAGGSKLLTNVSTEVVNSLLRDLQERHKFTRKDKSFDDVISAQRESEKQKMIDLYEQMTEDEIESLKMYKAVGHFDQRMLIDFLADRRKGQSIMKQALGEEDLIEDDTFVERPPVIEKIDMNEEDDFQMRNGEEGLTDADKDYDPEEGEESYEEFNKDD